MRRRPGRGVGQLQKGRKWSRIAHDKDDRSRSMEQSSVVGRLSCWGIGINRLYHIGRHWYRTFGSHRESRVEFSDSDIQMECLLLPHLRHPTSHPDPARTGHLTNITRQGTIYRDTRITSPQIHSAGLRLTSNLICGTAFVSFVLGL